MTKTNDQSRFAGCDTTDRYENGYHIYGVGIRYLSYDGREDYYYDDNGKKHYINGKD